VLSTYFMLLRGNSSVKAGLFTTSHDSLCCGTVRRRMR